MDFTDPNRSSNDQPPKDAVARSHFAGQYAPCDDPNSDDRSSEESDRNESVHKVKQSSDTENVGCMIESSKERTVAASKEDEQQTRQRIASGKVTTAESFRQACLLWYRAVSTVSHLLAANVLFMWAYYLPVVILAPHVLDAIDDILYGRVLNIIGLLMFFSGIALASIQIFSFRFAKNAIVIAWVSAFLIGAVSAMGSSTGQVDNSSRNVGDLLSFGCLSFGFFLIYKCKQPEVMSDTDAHFFTVTKDGTVSGLLKGLAGHFILINFVFYNAIELYLKSSLFPQLFFRFVAFPICFSLSRWIQLRVVISLSNEHTDRRLIIYKMCSLYIQFMGRILISNISTRSALSYEFVLVNVLVAVYEYVSTTSFDLRMRLSYRFQGIISAFHAAVMPCCKRNQRLVPIVPEENGIGLGMTSAPTAENNAAAICPEDEYVREATTLRARYVYDDKVFELYSVFLAPMLMYFISGLSGQDSSLQPIASFRECLYQIAIQLGLEVIADISSLAYEIRKEHIIPANFNHWYPMNHLILFVWTIFTTIWMHRLVTIYY